MTSHHISAILSVILLIFITETAQAQSKKMVNQDREGIAIQGYDPVAYHTTGTPIEGLPVYEFTWQEATWRFATEENRALFEANPERYAPRYGGYCAWAVSRGYTAKVDPQHAWRIVDGKLYLNYSRSVQKRWEKDIPGNIKQADANWPEVLK